MTLGVVATLRLLARVNLLCLQSDLGDYSGAEGPSEGDNGGSPGPGGEDEPGLGGGRQGDNEDNL